MAEATSPNELERGCREMTQDVDVVFSFDSAVQYLGQLRAISFMQTRFWTRTS